MPRSATAGEISVLASAAFAVHVRLQVLDTESAWRDLTNHAGVNWFVGYEVDSEIDHPIASGVFQVRRDSTHLGTPALLSLSPLRQDSPANRKADGTTFQSIVDAGRKIRFEMATIALGASPVTGDWKRLFEGYIDAVELDHEPMMVHCRDLGGELVDRWTKGPQTINHTASPRAIELVIQDILTAEYNPDAAPTLYTPTSPAFNIKTFAYDLEPLNEVLQRLISIIGWDLRYKWDDGTSSYRLTFYDPGRSKSVPDLTIGTNAYIDIERFAIDRATVRNYIEVRAKWGTTAAVVGIGADGPSIAKYGWRPLYIQEGEDSPIDTTGEAQAMADLILADLKDPKADHAITMLPFWRVELHDLIQHSANLVHYETSQNLAVVRFRHAGRVSADGSTEHRTVIHTRGSPAVAVQPWIAKGLPRIIRHDASQPIAVDVLPDGSVNVSLSGAANDSSWRYAYSTSAMPSDATAAAGAVVTGRQATVNIAVGLTLGQTIYVKAIPYPFTAGSGTPGPSTSATKTRENKVATKTITFPAAELVPVDDTQQYLFSPTYVTGSVANQLATFIGAVVIPRGVTITAARSRVFRVNAGDQAAVNFRRSSDDGTETAIANLTATSTSTNWQTVSASFTEVVGANTVYYVHVSVRGAANAADGRFLWLEIDYTSPDLATSY